MLATAATLALGAPVGATELRLALPADDDLASSLRGASLLVETVGEGTAARRDIVAAAQADYQRLLATLFEAGHFGPVISIQVDGVEAAELPVIGRDGAVQTVTISVQPGPRFLFSRAEIGPLARGTELPEDFAPGAPAGLSVLRRTAEAGIEAWEARGHAKAQLESQDITANQRTNRLAAELTLAPGPRLSYGPVTVSGARDVRPDRISRIADLRPGRTFDPEEIETAARRLQRTGAFRSVAVVEAEEIGPDATLPLTIQVVERLPRRFGVGAEVETSEGVGLTAFWLHRNLTGRADSLRIEGEITGIGGDTGGEDAALSFAYSRPSTFNAETDLYVSGEVESLDQPNFSADRVGLEVGAQRVVSDELTYSYGIAFDLSRTEDAFGTRDFATLALPLEAAYDRRDDPLSPADGYYVEAEVKPFAGFQEAGSGLRLLADMRGYQGFGDDRPNVVAARLQLGTVIGPDLDAVASNDLFFSGGGGTVRGQEFQSLGVDGPDGETVGGKSIAALSLEYRRQVTGNIGVVGFVDTALVSPDADWTGGDSHTGAGLGLRYDTGIGPIRVDFGVPVSQPGDASGVEIYIGIGQAF
jgi:translocation and assembly module TamA